MAAIRYKVDGERQEEKMATLFTKETMMETFFNILELYARRVVTSDWFVDTQQR